MACMTLKRSHDWDPLSSPATSNARPSKRLCAGSSKNQIPNVSSLKQPSPFSEVEPKITAEEISSSIKEEVQRLANRRQLLTVTTNSSCTPSLSFASGSASTFLFSPEKISPPAPCNSPAVGLTSPRCKEQPIFTFKQVGMICERLLREREDQLREQYDKILSLKLAEQYDTFVKFTYDQIQKRLDSTSTPSYLS